jgi:hypothetical protein
LCGSLQKKDWPNAELLAFTASCVNYTANDRSFAGMERYSFIGAESSSLSHNSIRCGTVHPSAQLKSGKAGSVERVMKGKENMGGMTRGPAARIALALVMVAGLGANAHAQNLSQAGPATDAVTGISQPGSFPIKITKSGSYRLNSNLTVKNSAANAIDVNVANVTIDLSGFTITGGLIAINGLTQGAANTTVSNGSITGSAGGVILDTGAVVRNVRVTNLTGVGGNCGAIKCGADCTATGDSTYNDTVCDLAGAITVGANSLVLNSTASDTTGGSGIVVGVDGNSSISGNTANGNASDGIEIDGPGVIITHNTANSNDSFGLAFGANGGAYGDNILINNATDVQGGTSLGGGNSNLCTGGVC